MKQPILIGLMLAFLYPMHVFSQTKNDTLSNGWHYGAGFGFDFVQLLQINPKQGAGQNRLGFGIAANGYAKFRKKRLDLDQFISWQFGIQKLGSGIIAQNRTRKIPFQKTNDEFRYNIKSGYRTSKESKWFYAANFDLITVLLPAYMGTDEFPGNFLDDLTGKNQQQSRFLNPATLNISIGIDFKPSDIISVYYSPLGAKFIFVADDGIAALGVHGNPVRGDRDPDTGLYMDFDNIFQAMGQTLRLGLTDKFWNDKATISSNILLFSNYLVKPENVDINWGTDIGVAIIKNFQFGLNLNVFYDDDVRVQITDFNQPNGVNGLGKRVSVTQQLLLKYNLSS
ncbi:MAG: DUF3078 domain-containing protein [Saprospiraceae bacterium]|nr:DUF3078 domain-containing protein [Saprospiraceae bacterium]